MMSLMQHLPKDRFNIMCAAFDTPAKTDEVLVAALKNRGLRILDERIPWHSRSDGPRAQQAIAEFVEKYAIDIVHTHDDQSNVIAGLGRDKLNCACVASPYGWWRRLFPLRSHLYVLLEKWVALPRFERLITVSEDMKRKILQGRSRPERVRVIYTGIDCKAFTTGASREQVRVKLGIPEGAFVAGTVSRLYEEKGHTYLIAALEQLLKANKDVWTVIVGTGPMRPVIENEVRTKGLAGRVVFTGYYEDLPGVLRAMDVLVQPSVLDEGLPTSILEAQAMGLPVIASDVGGVSESIEDGITGMLVPKKNARALVLAIGSLMEGSDRRREMGLRAAERIEQKFRLDSMVEKVAQVYEEAIAEYRGRVGT
jgi:glycosyltransferase involved in cell wall biosynthesis